MKTAGIFRDSLPPGCPSSSACEINTAGIFYRLVDTDPPTECDFRSQRHMHPNKDFGRLAECIVRGISLFDDFNTAIKKSKLPTLKGKLICKVILGKGAGYIEKTGGTSHYTWWPYGKYDIIKHCFTVNKNEDHNTNRNS